MRKYNSMHKEMISAYNRLDEASAITKERFDARMRKIVKVLLGDRYTVESVPTEDYREKQGFMNLMESAQKVSGALFRTEPHINWRQLENNDIWIRDRPNRIFNYVQKIADIIPPEYLSKLLRSSLNHTAEELISIYEANKGEAVKSDYSGQPTAIDPTQLRNVARLVR